MESCEETINENVPEKSYTRYLIAYESFVKWQKSKELVSFAEPVLLAYFNEFSMKFKPSTMWSVYSMLKSTLLNNNKVDISKYSQLLAFLKEKADGFQSRKTEVFTAEQVNTFLVEAPDSKYLAMKAVLVFGLVGACTGNEITNVKTDYVKDKGNEFIVSIPDTKTKVANAYVIDRHFAEIVRKYINLRPRMASIDRFFLQYRDGKCTNRVIGKNTVGKIPKEIAKFLKLPESEAYTGFSLRRASIILGDIVIGSETHIKRKYSEISEGEITTKKVNKCLTM